LTGWRDFFKLGVAKPILNQTEDFFPRWVLRLFRTTNSTRLTKEGKGRKNMKPLIRQKYIIPVFLIALSLACVVLLPKAYAVSPPPDGGYPSGNTAEGDNALFNLTTGIANTAIGNVALGNNTTGGANTAIGAGTLFHNITGGDNTAIGFGPLGSNLTGIQNTATGSQALRNNTTANNNTADGFQALFHNITGGGNTAIGFHALLNNKGSSNIALGSGAGVSLTIGTNNIDIGSFGAAGESNTIRIGSAQVRTFIKGISGAVVSGAAVVVNAGGQLGVAASSARFKDEIKPMDKASEAILALKPVSFRYKKEIDPQRVAQFGLVAEDVEKINPDLVIRDAQGRPQTVRYEQVNAMLLNEFLIARRQIDAQQEQIEALTAGLQKVSAQLQASKPAPQVVNNP
jgi:hypothetical protein